MISVSQQDTPDPRPEGVRVRKRGPEIGPGTSYIHVYIDFVMCILRIYAK